MRCASRRSRFARIEHRWAVDRPSASRSRILRSIGQQEGSQIFAVPTGAPESQWLARARSNLQVMYRTALAVSHTLDIDQLLQRIMQLIFEWVEADRGCIMLMNPETKQLEAKVRRDRKQQKADDKINISQTILDYVVQRQKRACLHQRRQAKKMDVGTGRKASSSWACARRSACRCKAATTRSG